MYDLTECRVYQDNDLIHRFDADFWVVKAGHPSTSIAAAAIGDPIIYPGIPEDQDKYEVLVGNIRYTAQNDFIRFTWASQDEDSFGGYEYKTATGYERDVLDCRIAVESDISIDLSQRIWIQVDYITGATQQFPAVDYIDLEPSGGNHLLLDFSNIWLQGKQLPTNGIAAVHIDVFDTNTGAPCDPITPGDATELSIYLHVLKAEHRNNPALRRWVRMPLVGRSPSGIDMQISFANYRHISPRRLFLELSSLGYWGPRITIDVMSGGLYHHIVAGASCGEVSFYMSPLSHIHINSPLTRWAASITTINSQQTNQTTISTKISPVFRIEWSLLDGNDQYFMRNKEGGIAKELVDVGDATGGFIAYVANNGTGDDLGLYLSTIFTQSTELFGTTTTKVIYSGGAWMYNVDDRLISIYDAQTIAKYEGDTGEVVPVPWLGKIDDITDQDVADNQNYLDWLALNIVTAAHDLLTTAIPHFDKIAFEVNAQDYLSGDFFPILPALLDLDTITFPYFNQMQVFAFGWMGADNKPAVEDAMLLPGTIGFDPATNAAFVIGSVDDHNNRHEWSFMDKYIDIARFDHDYHDIQISDFTKASRDGFIWFGFGVVGVVGFDCGGGCNGL